MQYKKGFEYRKAAMEKTVIRRLEREKRNVDSRRAARAADPKTAALDEVHRLLKKIIE